MFEVYKWRFHLWLTEYRLVIFLVPFLSLGNLNQLAVLSYPDTLLRGHVKLAGKMKGLLGFGLNTRFLRSYFASN